MRMRQTPVGTGAAETARARPCVAQPSAARQMRYEVPGFGSFTTHEYGRRERCASSAASDVLQDTRLNRTSIAMSMRTLISRYSSAHPTRLFAVAGAALLVVVAIAGGNISSRKTTSLTSLLAPARYADTIAPMAVAAAAPAAMDLMSQSAPRRDARNVSGAARGTAGVRALSQVTPAAEASYWASQKLIRSGDLRLLVKDVKRAMELADSIAGRHGALLAGSRASGDAQTSHDAELQFRVPADRFTETVAALRTLGDVRGESMTTQDVTKDYADLETRLGVKTETVTRLRTLLATHTAKLGDVLQVEEELARAVTELEQLKGERRFYDQQVALSSLSVTLFEQVVVPPRAHFTDPLVAACRHALEVLGASLAAVVYGLVFILPWMLLATLLWWVFTLLRPRVSSASS